MRPSQSTNFALIPRFVQLGYRQQGGAGQHHAFSVVFAFVAPKPVSVEGLVLGSSTESIGLVHQGWIRMTIPRVILAIMPITDPQSQHPSLDASYDRLASRTTAPRGLASTALTLHAKGC